MFLVAFLPGLFGAGLLGMIEWHDWDTAIVVTAAVVAMSCTLPGIWLVLRRQSMMGDALSHTALPGVVLSFLGAHWLHTAGWIGPITQGALEPLLLAAGAIVIGVLTALLTEWVQKLGRVESSAALGVVFTSLFALGLLLLRLKADDVHIDPDCVLFGQLELVVWNTVPLCGINVPVAVLTNGGLALINTLLLIIFYKELRLAAFDPELATSQGIPAGLVHYLLMGLTAATVVTAFESVGSILVVALLIVPAACGVLLCDRLSTLIWVSLGVAAGSAVLGHVLAKTLPAVIFSRLGFPQVHDAGTPGMVAVACGLVFVCCFLFSPRNGLVERWRSRLALILKMAADDVLAALYRFQERPGVDSASKEEVRRETSWIRPLTWRLTLWRLRWRGLIVGTGRMRLTAAGTQQAAVLVRSHRLWETYLQKHFTLPSDHLHESAHLVEHFIDQELRTQLEVELESPHVDPHGKAIPE